MTRAFLADFGLARRVATGSKLTRTGYAVGTPEYLSPEQARGETATLTPSADVWALGCSLYEAIAGRTPFAEGPIVAPGETAALVAGILAREPVPIGRLRPAAPAALERVLSAALAKDPRRRYRDGGALRDDLDRVLRGETVRAPAPGSRGLAIGAAVLALAFAAAAFVGRASAGRDAHRPGPADPVATAAARARSLRDSDPREAARLVQVGLVREPDRHDLRLEHGRLLWGLGDLTEARREWARVPDGAPEGPAARLDEALLLFFSVEEPAAARTESLPRLEALTRRGGPESPLAAAALALWRDDFGAAREALRDREGWHAALLRAAIEEFDPGGDRARAVRHYDEALAAGPPLAWAHHNRGTLLQHQGQHDRAIEALDTVLRIRPDFAPSLANRGLSRLRVGDPAGAIEDLDRVIAARPDHWKALVLRAEARQWRGDRRGALEDLDAAARARPGEAEVLRQRGPVRALLGDLAGAHEDLTAALAAEPGHPETLFRRGRLRAQTGDVPGALSDLDAAIAARAGFADALGLRGTLRRGRGELPGALADLEAAQAADPGSRERLLDLALTRRDLGDADGAVRDLTEALRLSPGDPVLLTNRGNAHVERGDLEAAERDHRAAIRADPDLAGAHANLGNVLEERGDRAGAAAEFREFLRLAPGHPAAAEFRARLAACEEEGGGRPGGGRR
ncbi:MAG: tetratricopeptide repeat protein [Planctomycetales bacterium]|nr:tetratricopeptide repeat protein [Planctomycetales bacterium]